MASTYLAFGDLHGQHLTLKELLRQVGRHYDLQDPEFHILGLGDYVDRDGPLGSSRETLDYLLEVRDLYPQTIYLRGNHDEYLLIEKTPLGPDCDLSWPLDSRHNDFLASTSYFLETRSFFFVHGSPVYDEIQFQQILLDNNFESLLWERPKEQKKFRNKTVVVGHTVVTPALVSPDLLMLDTGAGYGMKLTGAILSDATGLVVDLFEIPVV